MSIIIHRPTDDVEKGCEIVGVVAIDQKGNVHVTEQAFKLIKAELEKPQIDEPYED